MNQKVLNRFKSFGWRTLMMCLVIIADYVVNNLTGFGLPAIVTIVVGLVAGEVSKFLNTELSTVSFQVPVEKKLSTTISKKKVASKKK